MWLLVVGSCIVVAIFSYGMGLDKRNTLITTHYTLPLGLRHQLIESFTNGLFVNGVQAYYDLGRDAIIVSDGRRYSVATDNALFLSIQKALIDQAN